MFSLDFSFFWFPNSFSETGVEGKKRTNENHRTNTVAATQQKQHQPVREKKKHKNALTKPVR